MILVSNNDPKHRRVKVCLRTFNAMLSFIGTITQVYNTPLDSCQFDGAHVPNLTQVP